MEYPKFVGERPLISYHRAYNYIHLSGDMNEISPFDNVLSGLRMIDRCRSGPESADDLTFWVALTVRMPDVSMGSVREIESQWRN